MDPFSMIIAAGIAIVFGGTGIGIGKRLGRRSLAAAENNRRCGCTHALSFHDPKAGECLATVRGAPVRYSLLLDNPVEWAWVQCPCRQYDGPVSAEQIVAGFQPRLPESSPSSAHKPKK